MDKCKFWGDRRLGGKAFGCIRNNHEALELQVIQNHGRISKFSQTSRVGKKMTPRALLLWPNLALWLRKIESCQKKMIGKAKKIQR